MNKRSLINKPYFLHRFSARELLAQISHITNISEVELNHQFIAMLADPFIQEDPLLESDEQRQLYVIAILCNRYGLDLRYTIFGYRVIRD